MTDTLTASALRRWAMRCAAQAANPRVSDQKRERLLKMQAALRQLAETQDWLDGRTRARASLQSASPETERFPHH